MREIQGLRPAAMALLLLSVASGPAWAEVQLSGTADQILLQAKNATMPEVVSGLESLLHVKIRLTGSTTRQFTGVYSGSMRRVLSRLLDGTSYIISPAPEGLAIVVLAPDGAQSAPAAPGLGVREAADEGSARAAGWMGPNDDGSRRPSRPAQPIAPSARPMAPTPSVQPAVQPAATTTTASWMGPNDDGTRKPIQPRPATDDDR